MATDHPRLLAFATHIVNPIMLKFAGARFSPIALLKHRGRRSGKPYQTPMLVRQKSDGFILALTYGPNVDWYRNVQANRGGAIRWHGKDYNFGKPEPLDVKTGLRQFPRPLRPILRLNKVSNFVKVPVKS